MRLLVHSVTLYVRSFEKGIEQDPQIAIRNAYALVADFYCADGKVFYVARYCHDGDLNRVPSGRKLDCVLQKIQGNLLNTESVHLQFHFYGQTAEDNVDAL